MTQIRIGALVLLIAGIFLGNFIYSSESTEGANFKFKFGLDLSGGTHLVYRADTSNVDPLEVGGSMSALRDVIERRVNLFGVAEPLVQVEEGGAFAGVREQRLIVELPGVTDTAEAIALIGETPLLEFKQRLPLVAFDLQDQIFPHSGILLSLYTLPRQHHGLFAKHANL